MWEVLVSAGERGALERAVMEVLWAASDGMTVREVADALSGRGLAYTTVMTVLDRLAKKGMAERRRRGRAWCYRAAAAQEAYVAGLMVAALSRADSRSDALVRFARSISADEADALKAALADPPDERG